VLKVKGKETEKRSGKSLIPRRIHTREIKQVPAGFIAQWKFQFTGKGFVRFLKSIYYSFSNFKNSTLKLPPPQNCRLILYNKL